MSEAPTDITPAVTQRGTCEHVVSVGPTEYTVRHTWTPHQRGVKLTTTVFDAKKKGKAKASKTRVGYTVNTEEALSLKGAEMTDCALKNKRDWHRRQQRKQQQTEGGDGGDDDGDPGCCGDGRTGEGSGRSVTCPIISTLHSGEEAARGARSGVAKSPPADPPAGQEGRHAHIISYDEWLLMANQDWSKLPAPPPALLAKMKSKSADELLEFLASMGVKSAADLRTSFAEQERKYRPMMRAIEDAKLEMQTGAEEGRPKYETLLTAAVYGRDDDDPSAEPSAKRTANCLGVPERDLVSALKRAKRFNPDLDPEEAIRKGVYWYESPREERSEA